MTKHAFRLRDVLIEILDDEIPLLGENTHPYFRDVYDHLIILGGNLDYLKRYNHLKALLGSSQLHTTATQNPAILSVLCKSYEH